MDPNKLKTILSGAKAVMDAVDTGNYQKGNIDPNKLNASDNINESSAYDNIPTQSYNPQPQQYKNLHTTKMPKEIVEAMINNPIPIPETPFHTFELNEDLVKDINPEAIKKSRRVTDPAQRLAETKRNSTIGLTEEEVRQIVRDEMQEIIYEYFDQRVIKEDIQIKVGNTIFSGKLSPLPSKKTTKRK